ncbi:hypothetical protein G5V59_04445 [Nocardioides sp. W3-2-3]|uniref:NfeD family protein n=1 Tax=Nocardioides convexus TaxID=2712224 RepID=UPI0024184698|nr:hypothetical protein [Nocardioides convexus]NGZ99819.1 hypothetical protein [Nocardioides convexus]
MSTCGRPGSGSPSRSRSRSLLSLDLFLLMLAGGALAGMGTAVITDSIVAQVLVASAAALLLLVGVRPPLVRRLHGGPDLVLGPASLVGAHGILTEPVGEHRPGRVKIGGESLAGGLRRRRARDRDRPLRRGGLDRRRHRARARAARAARPAVRPLVRHRLRRPPWSCSSSSSCCCSS